MHRHNSVKDYFRPKTTPKVKFLKLNPPCSNSHRKELTEAISSTQHKADNLKELNNTTRYRSGNTGVKPELSVEDSMYFKVSIFFLGQMHQELLTKKINEVTRWSEL